MTELEKRLQNTEAVVGIIGLGYVGLPLVRVFVKAGFRVLGFDINARYVEQLNAGMSHIKHIPSAFIAELIEGKQFEATDDFARLREPDVIIICVPTPLSETRDPDLAYVESSARAIAKNLRKGQLVILESTTYPGTTEEVVKPILEESGLVCEKDFFLAYSPEREDPGNPKYTTDTIPKVVGGVSQASTKLAATLYSKAIVDVIPVSGSKVAEACKILENIYRAVNIALVNELKMLFERMDIDVWEVINAAKTKPFGFQAFYPGPGLGGHCIPIDPFYLSWKARTYGMQTKFIELAGEINTHMPHYVKDKITEALNKHKKALNGSKVLILGVAYKKDVDDIRESPALKLISLLHQGGADVSYNDPYIPEFPPLRDYPGLKMKSVELTEGTLKNYDCVVIITDHSSYDWKWILASAALIVDTRNATDAHTRENVIKA